MMIQTVHTITEKGAFHWIEKAQGIQSVNLGDPNDPNDPMKFVVLKDHVEPLIRESCIGACLREIDRNPVDLLDRLDHRLKSMGYEAGISGSPMDRNGSPQAGLFWVLPKAVALRGSRSPNVSACEEILKLETLK